MAIIKKESFFNPFAKSKVAFGLMQVYPKYHKEKLEQRAVKDERQLYHIALNVDVGCQIFKEYYDASNGDLDETFHKYLSKKATKAAFSFSVRFNCCTTPPGFRICGSRGPLCF